jgi:hypothetical protein
VGGQAAGAGARRGALVADGLVVARAQVGLGYVSPLAGLGTRGAGRGGRGVGGDRGVLGSAEDGEFAGKAVDLGDTKLVGTGCDGAQVTYHCLLFLLELQMEIGCRQGTRMPQRPGTGAHAGVIGHRGSWERRRRRKTRGGQTRRRGGVDGALV